jgi:E3 ubiquitin-protein ligase TRIP12
LRLKFSYNGMILPKILTFFESILNLMNKGHPDLLIDPSFWDEEHRITYSLRNKAYEISSRIPYSTQLSHVNEKLEQSWVWDPFFSTIPLRKLPGNLGESNTS